MFVAIDWDRDSSRVAVATQRATGAALARVASVESSGNAAEMAAKLREALPDVRWPRTKIVATVGGDNVAFRLLKLPPTPDNELPDMVRLLAEREFSAGDDGVVDFVPLSGTVETPRTVIAARVRRKTLDAIADLAKELDASVSRVVLRACSAASAAARIDATVGESPSLIVAPAGAGSADLVVVDAGLPVLVRTAKGDHSALGGEIRRTLSSASLQLGKKVERTISFGGEDLTDVSLETHAASANWKLPPSEAKLLNTAAGVAGAALDEAEQRTPVVDLLSPRKATVDGAPRRKKIMLAAAAGVLIAALVGQGYWSLARIESEQQELGRELSRVEASTDKWRPYADRAAAIDAWRASDVNWLDELEQLSRELRPEPLDSKEFSPDSDVMLTHLTATANSGREAVGGELRLDALARDADASSRIEQQLNDGRRTVQQGSLDQSGQGRYVWRFKPSVRIDPRVTPSPLSDASAPADEDPTQDERERDAENVAEDAS